MLFSGELTQTSDKMCAIQRISFRKIVYIQQLSLHGSIMCCNRRYISGYISDTACEVSCVGRCNVAFFMWGLVFVGVRIRSLHHGQEHIKDLFRQYFASLC